MASGDNAMVARAQGVGPKLAQRIVHELKDKAGSIALGPGGPAAPVGGNGQDARLRSRQSRLPPVRSRRRGRQSGGGGRTGGELGPARAAGAQESGAMRPIHVIPRKRGSDFGAAKKKGSIRGNDGGVGSVRMTDPDRLTTPERRPEDLDAALRPKTLDEFVGQKAARENLRVFIEAAKGRGDALDHVLFFGPPGLGKTTLAQIVARELGVGFRATSGPVIAKSGDLAALLTNLEDGDVLFIDEIHRLAPAVEEILYPAMEDRVLDLMIGEGPSARSVRIDLPKFTLVGATTRQGLITTPLRDRFGIPVRLTFYSVEELEQVVRRAARLLGLDAHRGRREGGRARARAGRRASPAGCCAGSAISPRRRAMPRWTPGSPTRALTRMEVDQLGLDAMDRRYLMMIADIYQRRPGRRGDARRRPFRAARHDRGSDRALSDPARPDRADRARPLPQRPRLDPSRPAAAQRRAGRPVRREMRDSLGTIT